MVLLPKGNVYNQGMGLVDVLWNAAEAIIYTWTKTVVTIHNVLHRFHASICTGIAILELNMVQELVSIDQELLLLLVLDLQK